MGVPTDVQLSVCKDSLSHSLKATYFNSQELPQDTLNYPINHRKTVKTSMWWKCLNTNSR